MKVAHPDSIEYWFEPEGTHVGFEMFYALVSTEMIVPANSSHLIHRVDCARALSFYYPLIFPRNRQSALRTRTRAVA